MKKLLKIVIVGRPNVGKSSLFNAIVGQRRSIVHELPGITRDYIESTVNYDNKKFILIDTGGYFEGTENKIEESMRKQIEKTIKNSDFVLFVVDAKTGIHPMDKTILSIIRKLKKPFIFAANKADNKSIEENISEFFELGVENIIPVSAVHKKKLKTLLEKLSQYIPEPTAYEEKKEETFKICLTGKPNAGKSSIINAILKDERVIVTDIPGTTRDEIDISYTYKDENFIFIDTAGLRKKKHIENPADQFGISRTKNNISNSDCNILVIDSISGITQQDKKIARLIYDSKKSVIIAINKIDLLEQEELKFILNTVAEKLPFLNYARIIPISAKTGKNIKALLNTIIDVKKRCMMKISTPALNKTIKELQEKLLPPIKNKKRLKIYYAVQTKNIPFEITLFINNTKHIVENYMTYIERGISRKFDLYGIPISFNYRLKNKKTS